MRRNKPRGIRPFYDGATDIRKWKARRRQERFVDHVGRRTLGLVAVLIVVMSAAAVVIRVNWASLSKCGLFVDVLHCIGMLAAFLIPCVVVLIPIRVLTEIPAFIFRKLMHTAAFAAVILLILKSRSWQAASLTFILAAVAAGTLLSILEREGWYEHLLVQKTQGEVKRSLTMYYLMLAALTAFCGYVCHQPDIAATAVMMWGTGDAAAALIGIPFGRHKVRLTGSRKSWEGSAAMLVISFISGMCMLLLVQRMAPTRAFMSACTAAVLGTAAELFSPSEFDTVTVPVVTAAVLMLTLLV